jgi:hypothetical protein
MIKLAKSLALSIGLIALLAGVASAEVLPPDRIVPWVPNSTIGVQASNTNAWTVWCCDGANVPGTALKLDFTGVTNSGLALQYAVNNAPDYSIIWLTNGILKITNVSGLNFIGNRSNIRIKGQGQRATILNFEGNMELDWRRGTGSLVTNALYFSGTDPVLAKGASNLVLATPMSGIFVGKMLYLSQASDNPPGNPVGTNTFVAVDQVGIEGSASAANSPYGYRANGQLVTVTALATVPQGQQVTFWPPSMWNMTNSFAPTLFSWQTSFPNWENWGLEDFSYLRTNRTSTTYGLQLSRNRNFWIKNVEFSGGYNSFIFAVQNLFGQIEYCNFHDTTYATPSGGYGIELTGPNTGVLIWFNIFAGTRVPGIFEGGSGNVYAYNHTALPVNSSGNVVKNPSIHGDFTKYMLLEGNTGWRMGADFTHGNNAYQTFHRNYAPGIDGSGSTGTRWTVTMNMRAYWYNFTGNVLGYPGMTGSYEAIAPGARDFNTPYIWEIGYATDGYTDYERAWGTYYHDTNVLATIIRHGNVDYLTGTTNYEASIADHTIPATYITGLTSLPSNWGAAPLPLHGPDVTGWTNRGPAQKRYEDYILAGDFRFEPSSTPPPSPPGTPSGLSASAQARYIAVQWNAVDGATAYGLQRSTDNSTWSTIPHANALLLDDTSVTVGVTYYYRVRAESDAGSSSYTASVNAAALAGPKKVTSGRGKVTGRTIIK